MYLFPTNCEPQRDGRQASKARNAAVVGPRSFQRAKLPNNFTWTKKLEKQEKMRNVMLTHIEQHIEWS